MGDAVDASGKAVTGIRGAPDQVLGTGDGAASGFRLVKHYGAQQRPSTRTERGSIRVAVEGVETADWTLEHGGWIVFDTAPPDGAAITAGFLFDVPVRFAEDRLDVSGLSFAAGEAPSVPLIEVREAA